MKCSVLFLVLLLSACASVDQPDVVIENAPGAVQKHRKSVVEQQPAAAQPPVSVEAQPAAIPPPVPTEAQQPARSDQGEPLPKINKHNVEED